MKVVIGLFIKSKDDTTLATPPNIHWLDFSVLEELRGLHALQASRLTDSVAIVKWQRKFQAQPTQNNNGEVVPDVMLWAETRQFEMKVGSPVKLEGELGFAVNGASGNLTTQISVEDFLLSVDTRIAAVQPGRTALVFWGHGDGPGAVVMIRRPPAENFESAGQTPMQATSFVVGDWLDLLELHHALSDARRRAIKKYDVLCFNACQVATLELATVLQPHGRLMVANQSGTPVRHGLPFREWPLALDPSFAPDDAAIARQIVTAYSRTARPRNVISVVALDKIAAVLIALTAVCRTLLQDWNRWADTFHAAAIRCPVIPHSFADKRDLVKFFSALALDAAGSPAPSPLAAQCTELVTQAHAAVVGTSTCRESAIYGYNGLSIFLPDGTLPVSKYARVVYASPNAAFDDLNNTGWPEVVRQYLALLRQTDG